MKRRPVFAIVILIVGSLAVAWSVKGAALEQGPEAPQPLDKFMRMKLEYTKGIVEGLALEDYEMIAKSAQSLSLLSLESNWNVLQTEEYLDQSREFRNSAKMIVDAAHEKNVDRAALGYVSLTVRCMECHKYLRRKDGDLGVSVPK
jgi:hypothetical protein